jgi:hypothetical protein
MDPMNQRQYREVAFSNVCPACGSTTAVEGEGINWVSPGPPPTFERHYGCEECGAEWVEEFVYRGYRLTRQAPGTGAEGPYRPVEFIDVREISGVDGFKLPDDLLAPDGNKGLAYPRMGDFAIKAPPLWQAAVALRYWTGFNGEKVNLIEVELIQYFKGYHAWIMGAMTAIGRNAQWYLNQLAKRGELIRGQTVEMSEQIINDLHTRKKLEWQNATKAPGASPNVATKLTVLAWKLLREEANTDGWTDLQIDATVATIEECLKNPGDVDGDIELTLEDFPWLKAPIFITIPAKALEVRGVR